MMRSTIRHLACGRENRSFERGEDAHDARRNSANLGIGDPRLAAVIDVVHPLVRIAPDGSHDENRQFA
jgi:hypothetical protein